MLRARRPNNNNMLELFKANFPSIHFKDNSLEWWKKHEQLLLLTLAAVARRVLNIPATSAASDERIFSGAGLLITPKRSSLNCNTVAEVAFLQNNRIKAEAWKNRNDEKF
eukprot:gene16570-22619_t